MKWVAIAVVLTGQAAMAQDCTAIPDPAERLVCFDVKYGTPVIPPDREARKRECERSVADWDAGRHDRLLREFGDFASEIVSNCRWMLDKRIFG